MTCRQTVPKQWLILDVPDLEPVKRLPRGSGVLLVRDFGPAHRRQLRYLGRSRALMIVRESPRSAARVHNLRELTRAFIRGSAIVLVSPVYPTRTHPDWKPLHRMRAAALAQLTNRRAIALGGMDNRRFAVVAPLGFIGWAGKSAFRT